jgi:hypothetical protein
LGAWLNRIFPRKKKETEEWKEQPPATPETPKPQEWRTTEQSNVPGPRGVKRALATVLTLLYAATIFTVPMDTFTAGLTLCTVYIMLDYIMMTKR